MGRVESIFFDLDGTLTDPKIGITRCIQHALERLRVPAPAMEELTWCIGPPLIESFRSILGDDGSANVALELYRERFSDTGLYENEVYDGVLSSVGFLSRSGISLYVATSKPQVYAERIVEHFGLAPYFERVFGPTLEGHRMRKSDLLRHALAEVGVAVDAALMVGDRSHDMIGARDNRVRAAGVLYGYGTREELETAGAERLIPTPGDLRGILEW